MLFLAKQAKNGVNVRPKRKTSKQPPDFMGAKERVEDIYAQMQLRWKGAQKYWEKQKDKNDVYVLLVVADMVTRLTDVVNSLMGKWSCTNNYTAVCNATRAILSRSKATEIARIWKAFDEDMAKLEDDSPADTISAATDVTNMMRSLASCLQKQFKEGQKKATARKAYPFSEAVTRLLGWADMIESFSKDAQEHPEEAFIFWALNTLVRGFHGMLTPWSHKCENPSYSQCGNVCLSITCKLAAKRADAILTDYDHARYGNQQTWDPDSPFASNSFTCEEADGVGRWLKAASDTLNEKERTRLIIKFIEQGQNPLKVETWLSYICTEEYQRTYCDPTGRGTFLSATSIEIRNAFVFLTAFPIGDATLFNTLIEKMHYHREQCAKLLDVGPTHPLTDLQFRYLGRMKAWCDDEDSLIISLDTKAFIALGRMKHDGCQLLVSNDGSVYRTLDHDFTFRVRDIYPQGHAKIHRARMNEPAILHPVGAYCPQDKRGYVALVLGKDTPAAMCNMIRTVLRLRARDGHTYKNVIIFADGGGVNQANGILWTKSLLDLSTNTHVNITCCHYPPYKSKYNSVERALWATCSRACRGKPYLDIEHVLRYYNEASSKDCVQVIAWFDGTKYLTDTERKARGGKAYTRAALDKDAGNRVLHHFHEDTAMYSWNYTVFWSEEEALASRNSILERTQKIFDEIRAEQEGEDAEAARAVKVAKVA